MTLRSQRLCQASIFPDSVKSIGSTGRRSHASIASQSNSRATSTRPDRDVPTATAARDVAHQVSFFRAPSYPLSIVRSIMPCTPFTPFTTCVTRKSTAREHS
jgi:hypothetical protein